MKFLSLFYIILTSLSIVRAGPPTSLEVQQNSAKGLRLLSLAEGAEPVWKTEDEKLELLRSHVNFFDVTEVYDADEPTSKTLLAPAVIYPNASHQLEIKPILSTISTKNMQLYLGNLTAFNNRWYKAPTGAEASAWILKTVDDIASTYPDVNATVGFFKHTWVQSSIIAKIPGKSDGPITILGAHIDSVNWNNAMSARAPGADDDGSGTVNLIEAFRALLASGFQPSNPVEFQWYSGEEDGLLGSQAIAKNYKTADKQVKAMMQLDMTAYFKPGTKETIALMPDYTDKGLNTFLISLIETYSSLPWTMSKPCGYGCSDHASWNALGYPASLPFETSFGEHNREIHTTGDTVRVPGFSWSHTLEYAKLAVAFAYELAI